MESDIEMNVIALQRAGVNGNAEFEMKSEEEFEMKCDEAFEMKSEEEFEKKLQLIPNLKEVLCSNLCLSLDDVDNIFERAQEL